VAEWGNPVGRESDHLDRKVRKPTRGTETSQYPEEEKSTERLLVAASERGQRSFESVPKPFPLGERGCRIHGRSWGERAEVPWNGLPERVRAP